MTKEENIATLNEHLDHWKRLLSEKICDQDEGKKTIDALQNAIKALAQEPTDAVDRVTIKEYLESFEVAQPKMGSSAENPNKWIPVSERLPETTDYYLVTVGINEYGFMIPSVRTALYNAETKDFTIHTGTNMCIVGDVVAWRDCLPEPYKAESEDKE